LRGGRLSDCGWPCPFGSYAATRRPLGGKQKKLQLNRNRGNEGKEGTRCGRFRRICLKGEKIQDLQKGPKIGTEKPSEEEGKGENVGGRGGGRDRRIRGGKKSKAREKVHDRSCQTPNGFRERNFGILSEQRVSEEAEERGKTEHPPPILAAPVGPSPRPAATLRRETGNTKKREEKKKDQVPTKPSP